MQGHLTWCRPLGGPPSTSSAQRQEQWLGPSGSGKRSRRRTRMRKSELGTANSSHVGRTVNTRAALGPACDSSNARDAGESSGRCVASTRSSQARAAWCCQPRKKLPGSSSRSVGSAWSSKASPPAGCLKALCAEVGGGWHRCRQMARAQRWGQGVGQQYRGARVWMTGSLSIQKAQEAACRSAIASRRPTPHSAVLAGGRAHLSDCSLAPARLLSRHPSVLQREPPGSCGGAAFWRLRHSEPSLCPSLDSRLAMRAVQVGTTHLCMSFWPMPRACTQGVSAAAVLPSPVSYAMHWDCENNSEKNNLKILFTAGPSVSVGAY